MSWHFSPALADFTLQNAFPHAAHFSESSQIEVLIAIAVGGVLTILTICLIIIYVLVSRDSWTGWCWCLRGKSPQHRQGGSDISELGRSVQCHHVINHQMYKEFISLLPCLCIHCHCSRRTVLFPFYFSPHFTSHHCELSVPRPVSDRDRNFTILTTIDRNIYIQR